MVKSIQFAIPHLQRDFLKMKESMLLDDVYKCSDQTIYSKIANVLEVLDHKIKVLGALAEVCKDNNNYGEPRRSNNSKAPILPPIG